MPRRTARDRRSGDSPAAQLWASIATLLLGIVSVMVFIAALPRAEQILAAPRPDHDALRARIEDAASFPAQWSDTLDSLCNDPVLQAEGIAANCTTGTITFGDDLFDDSTTVQLTEEGIRKLHQTMRSLLQNLRTHDEVWNRLESIELRGHADPRALRDPYLTNMRFSQERPMAVMVYLTSDWGLPERDRKDLERLLILSAASHSRPPDACPEATIECFPFWRRVEITPRLRGAEVASEMDRLTTELQALIPKGS